MEKLEDDFTWVIRKAFKGLALAPAEAARRAGLPEQDVLAFSKGKFSAETARQLAPVLGLDADALAGHDRYLPRPLAVPEIVRLELPFDDGTVNAWLVHSGGTAVLFDTGDDPKSCPAALQRAGVSWPDAVFITHAHPDHVGANDAFLGHGVPLHGPEIRKARPIHPGDAVPCGPLSIRACDLSGHADPSLGYQIHGLETPVLVTGDALFAGSIGGCGSPALYRHALRRLREILAPLPDATVLLPGHGPATTLGEERAGNPFL